MYNQALTSELSVYEPCLNLIIHWTVYTAAIFLSYELVLVSMFISCHEDRLSMK